MTLFEVFLAPCRTVACAIAGATLITLGTIAAHASTQLAAVDANVEAIVGSVNDAGFTSIASIDHARLAAAEGVGMPPSRVEIFSDPAVNTPLLSENIRAGLDLPFRMLSYDQDGNAQVMYTGAEFLRIRHGLYDGDALDNFTRAIELVAKAVDTTAAPTDGLSKDFGIIELTTGLSVADAVSNLTDIVMAQGDTVWFGKIDFAADAAEQGVDLPDAVLLLFGGPAPGGVAMADFPAIGLDAFCQKLLVYAGEDGGSVVIFNDIAALAELHYGASIDAHHALNERLTATFQKAIQ